MLGSVILFEGLNYFTLVCLQLPEALPEAADTVVFETMDYEVS